MLRDTLQKIGKVSGEGGPKIWWDGMEHFMKKQSQSLHRVAHQACIWLLRHHQTHVLLEPWNVRPVYLLQECSGKGIIRHPMQRARNEVNAARTIQRSFT